MSELGPSDRRHGVRSLNQVIGRAGSVNWITRCTDEPTILSIRKLRDMPFRDISRMMIAASRTQLNLRAIEEVHQRPGSSKSRDLIVEPRERPLGAGEVAIRQLQAQRLSLVARSSWLQY